jgi:valyl-tRNA synthetase
MKKVFEHQKYEKEIYKRWEKSGIFTPKISKGKKPFCIIMPPPNANDDLHIGHARFVTIEDVLIRYQRMKGSPTLWLPGADHAGIETQYVFEKRLREKEESRFDYDRETFYQMLWDYCWEYKGKMENQLRALGASCDWSRNTFTLDPKIVKIVYRTFKKLYDEGLVYRGEQIVNYCPKCGTAFSQLEVDYGERDDPMYWLDYKKVTIATTRPETIFADVAVAVNPKDASKKRLIGKKAVVPIVNREIPIIADALVDKDFGTGALKVTPGHDPTDFEIGKSHDLPIISVIDKEGKMINTPAKYVGMRAGRAREAVVADLEREGAIKKITTIHHTVGTCYRCKGTIEPTILKQWFIKMEPLTKLALKAIRKGEVRFAAKKYEKIGKHWLGNLRDWNISRQIVWGMRIPAWKCEKCLEWVITEGTEPKECTVCGHKKLTQDTDTFDTWFSSGQWPFATLKASYPGDFEYFYPTTVMETAYDILPFWVLRMIMLGLWATGKVPFKEVVIHGLVRDKLGQKISKSKGNVINPLIMIEKYGADALRMGIIWGALVENDISLSEDKIRGQRNFGNKIWNVARFVLRSETEIQNRRPRTKHEDDKWILMELMKTKKKMTKALEKYRLNEAVEELYSFVWKAFADRYIEKTKKRREDAQQTLEYVLQESLKLAHPLMPFVTEAIWSTGFARDKDDLLINAPWPV